MKTLTIILFFTLTTAFNYAQHAPFANFNPSQNSYIDYGKGQNLSCISNLSSGNKITVTMWLKWTDKGAAGVGNWANLLTLADSTGSGDNGVFWVQHNSDNTRFEFAIHTNTREYVFSTTNPVNGQWYFLSLVYDGSLPNNNMKIYVNGILESTLNKTGNIRAFPAASKLNMGRWPNPGNSYRHYNGKMDEISIWNIALTQAQIQNMMISSESVTGTSHDAVGLIGYWNFDNSTAEDLSPCHNNGIVGEDAELPVTLMNFETENFNGKVRVKWITSAEINNDYYDVERSQNGVDFEMVGKVNGSGNSNVLKTYEWVDENPYQGISYYRLKQVDFDGISQYSFITSVAVNGDSDFSVSIFPNPSQKENVFVRSSDSNFILKVFDMAGREVYNSNTITGLIEIPSELFQKGVYIVQAQNSENTSKMKLVKE